MKVFKLAFGTHSCQKCRAKRHYFFVFGNIFLLLGLFTHLSAQSTFKKELPQDKGNYKIGVGDVLKIFVLKQDILSQDGVRVSNEGTLRMPMLEEEIPAACFTEAELALEITNRYKKYLLNPQVYVSVKEFNANPIAVVGAVNAPGRFQLQRPMRLLELLTYVNGPSLNAGQNVQIFRDLRTRRCGQNLTEEQNNPTSAETAPEEMFSLSLPELMKGIESANPYVQAGDIVRVTEAEVKQAFVIGNVKTAVTVNLKEPVTLSKALALAGGFSQGAQTDKIKITRQSSDSLAKTEILVNLKDTSKRNQEDIWLQPNDIVEVPGPKPNLLKDIFRTVIPAVTRVPISIP